MDFDPTLTITGIIAISAIVSPIFTSWINKHYEVKLQKINLIFPKKCEIYEDFINCTNDLINDYNDVNLEYFHKSLDLLLLYTNFNWMFLDEILESAKNGNKHRASVNLKRISKKLRKQMKY